LNFGNAQDQASPVQTAAAEAAETAEAGAPETAEAATETAEAAPKTAAAEADQTAAAAADQATETAEAGAPETAAVESAAETHPSEVGLAHEVVRYPDAWPGYWLCVSDPILYDLLPLPVTSPSR